MALKDEEDQVLVELLAALKARDSAAYDALILLLRRIVEKKSTIGH